MKQQSLLSCLSHQRMKTKLPFQGPATWLLFGHSCLLPSLFIDSSRNIRHWARFTQTVCNTSRGRLRSHFPRARTPFGHALVGPIPLGGEGASAGWLLENPARRHPLRAKRSCQRPPSLPCGQPAVGLSLRSSSLPGACPNRVWARGQKGEKRGKGQPPLRRSIRIEGLYSVAPRGVAELKGRGAARTHFLPFARNSVRVYSERSALS
ncbi:hypothetical protein EV701_120125 [Chthoniobacter flavus]|nr:hypothetical protein EV701_120125 [Chthoniobacter flavus]